MRSTRQHSGRFSVTALARALKKRCPDIQFALLHGSARDGVVRPGGDVDLAVFVARRPTLATYRRIWDAAAPVVRGAEIDAGILNGTEPVYRFEALKGRLLFTRSRELYCRFFSLACREYESQMASYERQKRYRLAAQRARRAKAER